MTRNTHAEWGWPAKLLHWIGVRHPATGIAECRSTDHFCSPSGPCKERRLINRQVPLTRPPLEGPIMSKLAAALMASLAIMATANSVTGEPAEPYMPGLVEFMMNVQSHHTKLWLAGNGRNWDLADYQADELKELLEDIAKRVPDYKGTPVGKMIESITMPPIGEVESAIKARDLARFTVAFDKLTAACNACHEAANRGFIVVQRPATSPFPNQSFAPRRK